MSSNFQAQFDPTLQKRISGQILTGATTTAVGTTTAETIVKSDEKVLVSHEQHIASEIPVTQQKIVTQEFVPVIHEKIITTIPIVTEEKVVTGHAIAGGKQASAIGQAYMQGTKAEVELEAHLRTGIPMAQQQTMIAQVPVTTAHVEKDIIPVEVEKVRYDTTTVPVQVTNQTLTTGTLTQNLGVAGSLGVAEGLGVSGNLSEKTFKESYSSSGYDQAKLNIQQGNIPLNPDLKNPLNPSYSTYHHHHQYGKYQN